jgi:predicted nucleotidyltransferase
MGVEAVIARRRRARDERLAQANAFVRALPDHLGVRAAAVFGSVARGDFNLWSDTDVLVLAEHLPSTALQRFDALGAWPAGVQPVAWTPAEWHAQLARGNPIAREAGSVGVWLLGAAPAKEK